MILAVLVYTLDAPTALPPWRAKDLAARCTYYTGFSAESLVLGQDGSLRFYYTDDVLIAGEEDPVIRIGNWTLKNEVITITFDKSWKKMAGASYIPVRWGGAICLLDNRDPEDLAVEINQWWREARTIKTGRFFKGPLLTNNGPNLLGPIKVPKRFLKDFAGIK